ncbi:VirB4 family type IV secretion system protein [Actinokineospora sp. HUAS TT18]|uniref:VirB4 family type IV secretion system protein n=1 Tax=Actinokineospora sp. HUAS TT18 TaxID=3447451 RepID=UPI003F522231
MATRARTRTGKIRPQISGPRRDTGRGTSGPVQGAAAFSPDSLSVGARHLEVGGEWVSSFAVTGFPREVHPGWLSPLLSYPGRVDVSLHLEPIDPATAAARLKKQLAKLESGRRHTADHGRLHDPQVDAATEDAYDLSSRIARGEGKLYRVGLYLTIHATSEKTLADEVAALRSLCASLLLDAKHTTYRSLQGWVSCLPMGLDLIGMRRTFDTSALSAAFPFTSPDLPPADPTSVAAPSGVLYGYNVGSQSLVHWDRFAPAMHNHNSVILGRSGSGKSYLVKLELLRSLYRGIEIAVIDPEDEYARLAAAVGGTYVHLGAANVRLNPFDLPIYTRADGRRTAPRDALIRRSLYLHTVIGVLVGTELEAAERAALDRGIAATYQAVGITADARTWTRPAPTLRGLRDQLATAGQAGDRAAADLAARLHPFVEGAFKQLFDGQTTTNPEGHLTVFSLRDLPDELKGIGTLLVLDAVWRRVSNPAIRRPRLVVVDEAWLLMREKSGGEFLFRMAKAARKHWAGLTVATQDTADVLGSELGKAVIANAATQVLLRQASQAIDDITATFDLSAGERQFLLSADRGQGLLSAGTQRVAFQSLASPTEHFLVTSNPAELAGYAADGYADESDDTGQSYVDVGFGDDSDGMAGADEFGEFDSGDQVELDAA